MPPPSAPSSAVGSPRTLRTNLPPSREERISSPIRTRSPSSNTTSSSRHPSGTNTPASASYHHNSPYMLPVLSGSTSTFKTPAPQASTSSLTSATSASVAVPSSRSAVGGPRSPSVAAFRTPSTTSMHQQIHQQQRDREREKERERERERDRGEKDSHLETTATPSTTPTSSPAPISTLGTKASASLSSKKSTRSKSPIGSIRESKEKDGKDKEKEQATSSGKENQNVRSSKSTAALNGTPNFRTRTTPHLPLGKDVEPAPATLMYWSKAPVYGVMPAHGMRAHSVTLIDSVAWIFGGCDERGCWKDVWCFNTETMQWSHPETLGDVPPPCRAHTSTLVDRRLIIFGGGEGPVYRNDVYILDTPTRRWYQPRFPPDMAIPPPRRAHTTVFYKNKVWVFGGGNGSQALNDLWTLDCGTYGNAAAAGGGVAWGDRMKWEMVNTKGRKPTARGYHTANLVGSVMVVMGGSDGRECFSDIWCLNLDTLYWSQVKLDVIYRRLSHTATQVGSYLFIWGGHDGTQYTSDLLLFNLVSLTFETRPIGGKPPSPRGYHAALIADSRLFVFGGFNGNEVFDDVYNLDLAGAAYLPQVTSFKIDVD